MDIPTVLERLRPHDDWGPGASSHSTYDELVAGWRGLSPVPTQSEMLAEWQTIVNAGGLAELQRQRDEGREPQTKREIRSRAAQTLSDLNAFLALSNPTAAQVRDQVRLQAQILRLLLPRMLEV